MSCQPPSNGQSVDRHADNPQPAKAETNFDTIHDFRVEAFLDMLAETVPDAKVKIPLNTMGDMKVKAIMDTLAATLEKAKVDTLGGTSTNEKADILVNKLKYNVAQAVPQTRADRLSDVEVEALDDMLCFCKQ